MLQAGASCAPTSLPACIALYSSAHPLPPFQPSCPIAPGWGILRTDEFAGLRWEEGSRRAALADVMRVHEWNYVKRIQVCVGVSSSSAAE